MQPIAILPDGSSELLVSCLLGPDGAEPATARVRLFGVKTSVLCVEQARPQENVSVRLRPGALGSLLPVPASELTDRALPAALLWGPESQQLEAELGEAADARDRLQRLQDFLLRQLPVERRPPAAIVAAMETIRRCGGSSPLRLLVELTGIGERRLERLFRRHVGFGPKRFSRLVRFHAALRALRRGRRQADVAAQCGYSDQSHMVREFRAFSAQTPVELMHDQQRVALSEFFKTDGSSPASIAGERRST